MESETVKAVVVRAEKSIFKFLYANLSLKLQQNEKKDEEQEREEEEPQVFQIKARTIQESLLKLATERYLQLFYL